MLTFIVITITNIIIIESTITNIIMIIIRNFILALFTKITLIQL